MIHARRGRLSILVAAVFALGCGSFAGWERTDGRRAADSAAAAAAPTPIVPPPDVIPHGRVANPGAPPESPAVVIDPITKELDAELERVVHAMGAYSTAHDESYAGATLEGLVRFGYVRNQNVTIVLLPTETGFAAKATSVKDPTKERVFAR
jgi:hypothetical protein